MKNKEWNEILKKCFGKEKDDRYHAIAMLGIYGIFMIILIVLIRVGGTTATSNQNNNSSNPTPSPTSSSTTTETPAPTPENNNKQENNSVGSDINYSYSYTVTYNGVSEVYLGKKLDEKEKFTLIKEGITTEYGILNDNYLVLQNGSYHITESPSRFFKYCDVDKILSLVENKISTENEGTVKYTLSNKELDSSFKDDMSIDNEQLNSIQLYTSGEMLKGIDIDFSNYYSSVQGTTVTLTIHMEFADIGTTEDFELNIAQ